MSRLQQYLHSASVIIKTYQGEVPFATWLKDYFRTNKKFGSRDRKLVADLCFCYYRLGDAFAGKKPEERLLLAQAICYPASAFVAELKPEWKEHADKTAAEKFALFGGNLHGLFPQYDEVSAEVEAIPFCLSHLVQPDVFLRCRRNKRAAVVQKLESAGVDFSVDEDCIRLRPATKAEGLVQLDKEAVVQDKSSQAVIQLLKDYWQRQEFSVWDCCAASGGKTILLRDHYPQAKLTASDVRSSILQNLRNRFSRAGISQYKSFVYDMTAPDFTAAEKYNLIICDAPCTGSGTWARAPENLGFFLREKLAHYQQLQQRIASNASKALLPDGYLLYITCSVFAKENEEVVAYLQKETELKLIEQRYLKGYEEKADTLFAALFRL